MTPFNTNTSAQARNNAEWLRDLTADGAVFNTALADLRDLLYRALQAHLLKNQVARREIHIVEAKMLADDCVQEALLLICRNLNTFRGDSQFSTWAYAIAMRHLLREVRMRRWRRQRLADHEIGNIHAVQAGIAADDPARQAQLQKLWTVLQQAVTAELSERQRFVLIGHTIQDVPLDVLAQKLGTNRDNTYKILHDARKRLKKALSGYGIRPADLLALVS